MIYLQDPDFTLIHADVIDGLRSLPDESVHMVVTSPPYWGLRDYGTGAWDGGDPDCDHTVELGDGGSGSPAEGFAHPFRAGKQYTHQKVAGNSCKCGARRVDQQLGLEPTPDLYVARMVEVFREVRRVLRADGTCWVNMGDSYISGQGGRQSEAGELPSTSRFDRPNPKPRPDLPNPPSGWAERAVTRRTYPAADSGWKPKDLAGMPWRVAFALQADGWYLRSDIIWSKPNPMPESVTDRPTKAHEYLFLLSKSPRYFFDQEAVREQVSTSTIDRQARRVEGEVYHARSAGDVGGMRPHRGGLNVNGLERDLSGRNVRSVWEITTQPYPEAHFATFPEELVRRCILAGCPEGGLVLDPFMGSGTTALVARKHGRRSIGIELNQDYCELAARRLAQQSLLAQEVA